MSTQAFTFLQQASNDGSFDHKRADEKRDGCNIFMYDLFVEAIRFLLPNNLFVPTPVVDDDVLL